MFHALATAAGGSPDDAAVPLWTLILIGMLSGVFGAIAGPIMQRTFGRNDRALQARQVWVKEKLQTVFGVGDEKFSSDGPQPPFFRLVPPHSGVAHHYDMHTINSAVEESTDLMMLQPRRSAWAREWLMQWHFRLQPEARVLHQWRHYLEKRFVWTNGWLTDTETGETANTRDDGNAALQRSYETAQRLFSRADEAYRRRVRRVQSSLSIWATGQWVSKPSWWHWVWTRQIVQRTWPKSFAARTAPVTLREGRDYVPCDCRARAFEALRILHGTPGVEAGDEGAPSPT